MHLIHPKYRADIDGLRAIAVLLVIGFHAFPKFVKAGFIGVDIFFVISGFLISTIIFHSLESDRFTLLEFYNRRIRRILPSLLIVLLFCMVIGWPLLLPYEYKQLGKHIFGGSSFSSNFILWQESGYFDVTADKKPLLHLWSLAIEEQFYIFWPLLLVFIVKRKWNFFHVTVSVALISFAANIYLVSNVPVAAFYLPISRVWELMVGGLLAHINLSKPELKPANNNVQSILGFGLIIISLIYIDNNCAFPSWWALLPTLGSFFIIYAGPNAFLNKTVFSNKYMVFVGLISYPLYLWHWPLLTFARIAERATPSLKIRIIVVFISFVLAWLTYKLIETHFRSAKNGNAKSIFLLIALLLIGCIGSHCFVNNGYKQKRPAINSADLEWPENKMKTKSCIDRTHISGINYCLLSENFEPTVALIGDSHANAIFDAVNAEVVRKGGSLIMLGKGGCPPFLGVERDNNSCPQIMEDIVKNIVDNKKIKDVIITGRFAATYTGVDFGHDADKNFYNLKLVDNRNIHDRKQIFRIGLDNILRKLNDNKKRVTIVLDSPELDFEPASCINNSALCSIKYETVIERQKEYTDAVKNLQDIYRFNVVDLKDVFCREGVCTAKSNNHILYRDMHHLGIYGNQFITDSGFQFSSFTSLRPTKFH